MPIIRIEMLEGRSPDKKAALIRRVTQAVVETLEVDAQQVRVLLYDIPREHWGVGGKSKAEEKEA